MLWLVLFGFFVRLKSLDPVQRLRVWVTLVSLLVGSATTNHLYEFFHKRHPVLVAS
jgi:hypothetical protein